MNSQQSNINSKHHNTVENNITVSQQSVSHQFQTCQHPVCNCEKYLQRINELENLLNLKEKKEKDEKRIDDILKNNPLDLSEERIYQLVQTYYTHDLFMKGSEGLLLFIYSYIVRSEEDQSKIVYRCVDKTKKIFHYYDEERGICADMKCKILLQSLYPCFVKRLNTIYRQQIDSIYREQQKKEQKNNEVDSYSDDEEDEEEYDSDIEEILAKELLEDESDNKINSVVSNFLEIKKYLKTNKKALIDELCKLLYYDV